MCGLIFIILTTTYSPILLNFAFAQRGNFHFGNQGMENAGGQIGQGNAGGQIGQGNAGGQIGQGNAGGQIGQGNAGGQIGQGNAKSIGGVGCPTGPKDTSSVA